MNLGQVSNPTDSRTIAMDPMRAKSTLDNYAERPPREGGPAGAWCYTDRLSYRPGDRIRVHTCATTRQYDLRLYRDGAVEEEVFSMCGVEGAFHHTPADCSVVGCGWPVAHEILVPADWKSGGYILHIRGYADDGGRPIDNHFPLVISPEKDKLRSSLVLVACTATWVAYNDWGGSNFYEGIAGDDGCSASPIVSTLRPFARGFAWLPEGAPRIPLEKSPPPGAALRYPHMEWAYANGFSKKYASTGWASYERHFMKWAESQGLGVDVVTQHDIGADPSVLDGYQCVAIVGHDEYWSWEMRDAIDRFTDRGGNIARFAGNFLWQIRVEDEGKRQVCYKASAEHSDPVRNTDARHLLTSSWDDTLVGRPAAKTFGLTGSTGIYVGWGGCVPRGSGGFTVYRPEHWAFDGTDLYYGDQLGAEAKIFGYEVDGCDYTVQNGLPYPTGADGAPVDMTIIAMGLATTFEADHKNAGSTLFISDGDARMVSHQLWKKTDEESIERVKRGSGMIVCFSKGRGTVFNAASCEWVSGLIKNDPFVVRLTLNVLERLSATEASA